MKPSNVFAWACVMASCAGLISLAALASGKAPAARPDGKLPEYLVLKPITYKNLTIFLVGLGDAYIQTTLAGRYITLDEGLKTGVVEVREMGGGDEDGTPLQRERPGRGGFGGGFQAPQGRQVETRQSYQSGAEVNRLALYNHSGKRLMLLAGEMVVGGRQDRIVQKDTLVPPSSKPLPLAVFCVEHGRWTAQTEKFGNQIGGGGGFGGGLADPSIRGAGQTKTDVQGGQGAVWGEVARKGKEFGADSPTGTYQFIAANPRVRKGVEDYIKAIQEKFPEEQVIGAVVAINGKLVWADVFSPRTDFFNKYWPKLLRSYATDALSSPPTASGYDRERWQEPTVAMASAFLRDRAGKATFEGQEDVYKLRRIESAENVIYDIEDIALDPAVLLHTCKMTKR